ncbi:MAG: hypothetical protein ACOYNC_18895 [Bacteroidales bacterium]
MTSFLNAKMKHFSTLTIFFLVLLCSCEGPDEKLSNQIQGTYFSEKSLTDGSVQSTQATYYKRGTFAFLMSLSKLDPETGEPLEVKVTVSGKWNVKEGFLHYNISNVSVEPAFLQQVFENEIRTKNTPDKIVEVDAQKLVVQNSQGEVLTYTKTE